MVPACTTCRIAIVRKRTTTPSTQAVHVTASIWALSNDSTTRLEIPLAPSTPYIPYASYFSPTKISLTVPASLRFHDTHYASRLLRSAHSSWISFSFDTPQSATLFQNELLGRVLLASFRTTKTMRVHEGALAGFAYAEQMCALEVLRVWEDGETGAVVGMVHFAAGFREGWLAFCINSAADPVRVSDCGAREVKVRGLRIPVERAGRRAGEKLAEGAGEDGELLGAGPSADGSVEQAAGGRRSSVASLKKGEKGSRKAPLDRKKIISGAKIEFATEAEKREFLELVQEYQRPGRLCDGSDLDFLEVG